MSSISNNPLNNSPSSYVNWQDVDKEGNEVVLKLNKDELLFVHTEIFVKFRNEDGQEVSVKGRVKHSTQSANLLFKRIGIMKKGYDEPVQWRLLRP